MTGRDRSGAVALSLARRSPANVNVRGDDQLRWARPAWHHWAACKEHVALFHATADLDATSIEGREAVDAAVQICRRCPVILECRAGLADVISTDMSYSPVRAGLRPAAMRKTAAADRRAKLAAERDDAA